MMTPPIRHRDQLVRLLPPQACGVELGVARGHYSAVLQAHFSRLMLVDRWSDHHDEAEHRSVQLRFQDCPNVFIMRTTFERAAQCFADGEFDFVYIDGYAHTGQENGKTLRDWWPKLKDGGVFAGHDYHPAWPLTVKAVDEFAAHLHRSVKLTEEQHARRDYPSWWFRK